MIDKLRTMTTEKELKDIISAMIDIIDVAKLFREHACNCSTINHGNGPKCAPCLLRDALAKLEAKLQRKEKP